MSTSAASSKAALYQELVPLLKDPRGPDKDGRIWSFCPCHADGKKNGRRSLSLHPTIGIDCFAGCTFRDIVAELRKNTPRPPESQPKQQDEKLTAIYPFHSTDGTVIAEKGRFETPGGRKTFKWRLAGAKEWLGIKPLGMEDMPLYNSLAVLKDTTARPVYLVEGEKACDACTKAGLLAATIPGGASQRSFGESLGILAGRHVILWADNDPAGRDLMIFLHARVRTIAKTVNYLTVPFPLPEKGDAFDYFGLGGKAEDLGKDILTDTACEWLGDESLRVRVPTVSGVFSFTFDSISAIGRQFDAELAVRRESDDPRDALEQRINALSASARTELRRDMDETYGKEHKWSTVINRVFAFARATYKNLDRSIDVASIEDDGADPFLIDPLIPDLAATVFFGDGSSAKTWLIEIIALHHATGQDFLWMETPARPVLYMDYEGNAPTFRRRMKRIAQGMNMDAPYADMVYYWNARGIPLAEQADALLRKIKQAGIGLLIIDSGAPACGGKPEDAEIALNFFRILARLKVAVVVICHINKGGDSEKPFGSIFWHNEPRRTWYVKRVQETDSPILDIGLYCKKANDGPRPHDIALQLHFTDPEGPVKVVKGSFSDAPAELREQRHGKDRIWDCLTRAMTAAEIAEITKIPATTVYKTLERWEGKKFARSKDYPETWARISRREE